MKYLKPAAYVLISAMAYSCANNKSDEQLTASNLDPRNFVTEVDGKPVALYTLVNGSGMEACITNFGGRIVSLMVPDRDGVMRDVVLGFDNIADYLPENNDSNFGAIIGRYGNRINQGRMVVDGDTVQLPQNNYGHCLHGGPTGWHYKVFDAEQPNDTTLVLTLVSPDGDNNFPGTVNAQVTYTLTSDNAIDIAYEAVTDKPTVINLTNHSYFNLNSDHNQPVTNHVLWLNADNFTPTDSTFMTTGEILAVAGTPMDFTVAKTIGQDINADYEPVKFGLGYDHNWVLNTTGNDSVAAARLMSPETGITLEVYTDEPGVQVYTGNFLDSTVTGKGGVAYPYRGAICLETQHYPDSPNKPEWPSVVVRPAETYTSHCVYKFGTAQ